MTPQEQWFFQKEKVLSWFRVGFAIVAILVIQLNPSTVARFPLLSYVSLGSFLAYSLTVLYFTLHEKTNSKEIGIVTASLDLIWVSLIVLSTGGTATPFFAYYFFPVITAGSRFGIKGGVSAAVVGVILYGYIRFNFDWDYFTDIDRFLVRSIYLIMLAYFFGFLSEFEQKQNDKLLALSKTTAEVAKVVERRRIIQDLHDGLLQSLATHILRLEICRRHLLESPRELDSELRSLEEEARSSMAVIRQFLQGRETHSLVPGMMLDKLKEDLRFLRDGLGLEVVLNEIPEDLNLPTDVEQDLYYVLREALMNIARHAYASHVALTIRQTETELRATLTDDGVGFDATQGSSGPSLGLKGMKDRIEKLGGELSLESSPGKGTKVSFTLPLAKNRQAA
jgi:signal transduction histidine kinase